MTDPAGILKPYRDRIDVLDGDIVELLARRMDIIREVGRLKAAHDIPSILQDRVDAVRDRAAALGRARGIDPDFMRALYTILIDHSCALEEDIRQNGTVRP